VIFGKPIDLVGCYNVLAINAKVDLRVQTGWKWFGRSYF